jgi:hypothetical protein
VVRPAASGRRDIMPSVARSGVARLVVDITGGLA